MIKPKIAAQLQELLNMYIADANENEDFKDPDRDSAVLDRVEDFNTYINEMDHEILLERLEEKGLS